MSKPAVTASDLPVSKIPLHLISMDPEQPRQFFDIEKLSELSLSIAEHGQLQPIIVRSAQPSGYLVVAGERRLRALLRLAEANPKQYPTIDAIVRDDITADDVPAVQLIENLQREGLTLAEQAVGAQRLVHKYGLPATAKKLGKSKSWVSRRATLNDLPSEIRDLVARDLIHDVEVAHQLKTVKDLAAAAGDTGTYTGLLDKFETDEHAPGRDMLQRMIESLKADAKTIEQAKERADDERQRGLGLDGKGGSVPPIEEEEEEDLGEPAPVRGASAPAKPPKKDPAAEKRAQVASRLDKRLRTVDSGAHIADLEEQRDGQYLYYIEISLTERQIEAAVDAWEGTSAAAAAIAALSRAGGADDELLGFTRDCLTAADADAQVSGSVMYKAYCAWAKKQKLGPAPEIAFAWLMGKWGCEKKRTNKGTFYLGYKLKKGK